MPLTKNFSRKLMKAKKLIAGGSYKKFFSALRSNALHYLRITDIDRSMKYLYLKKKYSSFIADRIAINLRNGGGVKLLTRPISYGGYGFRESIMRRMYARHVCVH